jgi:Ca-activated chloride channel family protein
MIDFDDDPRWTAYALGELDAAERAECEQILETNPEARAYVASLKEAIGTIETELAAQPAPALDELQRKRIEKAAQAPKRSSRRWLFGGSAAAAGIAALVFASSQLGSSDRASAIFKGEQMLRAEGRNAEMGSGAATPDVTLALEEGKLGKREQGVANGLVTTTIQPGQMQFALEGTHEQLKPPVTGYFQSGETAPNTEAYARIDDNQFHATAKEPLSTFSIDVDTASYANLRRYLESGQRPPKDAVRIEEMLNYFKYDYAAPTGVEPFSIATEVGPAPWNPKHQLMRVSLATAMIDNAQVPPRNLVFLIDTSGSMQMANKLPLVKQSLTMLTESLREQDQISIVAYAGAAGLVLPPTSGHNKGAILDALNRLEAGGSTNGGQGIQLAYATAQRTMKQGGINRVILCSDGDMNVGITSEGDLTRLIEKEREKGVFLTVLGYGMGNLKDSTMEKLADRGNGNYAYIDSALEARKVLVKQAGATLVTVAKDVKLQLEFNPTMVAGHRLIGYENRVLAHADFNNDKKDAGEIGAGHAVTALYELVPAGLPVPTDGKVDDLKYQTQTAPTAGASTELLTVKIRYKAPTGSQSKLLSRVVDGESIRQDLQSTSTDFRWASAIAGFGMLLRESPYRGTLTWQQVSALAVGARGQDADGYRIQAIKLIDRASKLPARP